MFQHGCVGVAKEEWSLTTLREASILAAREEAASDEDDVSAECARAEDVEGDITQRCNGVRVGARRPSHSSAQVVIEERGMVSCGDWKGGKLTRSV